MQVAITKSEREAYLLHNSKENPPLGSSVAALSVKDMFHFIHEAHVEYQ